MASGSGRLHLVGVSAGFGARPVVSADGAHVYAVGGDFVWAYSRDPSDGALTFVAEYEDGVGGIDGLEGATAVTVSPDGAHVYACAMDDRAVAVFSRNATTGELTFVEAEFQPDHLYGATSVIVSPDGAHVYASAWTTANGPALESTISVFSRDPVTGALTFVEAETEGLQGPSGELGPQSIAITPDGAHLYAAITTTLTSHFGGGLVTFQRDPVTGALTFDRAIVTLAFDSPFHKARWVTVSPDGAHVYLVSWRTGDTGTGTLSVFRRNTATGVLSLVDREEHGTKNLDDFTHTRWVAVDPDGAHVYVHSSAGVTVFSRDDVTGRVTFVESTGADLFSSTAIAVSPDGKHVYVDRLDDFAVWEDLPPSCTTTPQSVCRQPIQAGRSKLVLKDRAKDATDAVTWNWSAGEETLVADFGDPAVVTEYALCIYDRSGPGGTFQLVSGFTVPPAQLCSGEPCWGKQWRYKNRYRNPDGIVKIKLKAGEAGRAQAKVKGKGSNLGLANLPLTPPVKAQLQASNGECWGARYSTFINRNEGELFRARSGSPSGAYLDEAASVLD